jgi:hypothetical protein
LARSSKAFSIWVWRRTSVICHPEIEARLNLKRGTFRRPIRACQRRDLEMA